MNHLILMSTPNPEAFNQLFLVDTKISKRVTLLPSMHHKIL
jgi:hypothetical protein